MPDNVLTARFDLEAACSPADSTAAADRQRAVFYRWLTEALRDLPQAEASGVEIYLPMLQAPSATGSVVVRTASPAGEAARSVRIDPWTVQREE